MPAVAVAAVPAVVVAGFNSLFEMPWRDPEGEAFIKEVGFNSLFEMPGLVEF